MNVKKRLYVLKRLFGYVAVYKGRLLLIALLGLLGIAFEVAKPLPLKLVIDNVLSSHPLPAIFTTLFSDTSFLENKQQLLLICVLFLIIIAIGSFLFTFLVFNLTVKLAQRLVFDLMIDFYSKLQRLSLSFYTRNQVGDLTQRMNGDVFVVYFLVAQIILPALIAVVSLAAMVYIMVKIDLALALVAFSVVPIMAVVLVCFSKPMQTTTTVQYKTQGLFSAFLQQSLSSMKIIQAFGRESFMHKKLKAHAEAFSDAYIMANRVSMAFNQFSVLVTGFISAALVGLGAYRGLNGTISAGDIVIFLGYLSALYGPVTSLTTAIGTAIAISARGKRVFDILDSDEVVKEKPDAVNLMAPKGAVEFRNVSFGYSLPDGVAKPILSDISFTVEPGQVVALVGPTGTGKTSLISLLCRFYDPWKGTILMDGVDITDLKLHSLRENISLVLQEPFLFPMTIGENIAFGNPEASFDEVVEAAKGAQAHDFIAALPDGYDTKISESGSTLSGGERQRVAIARAFLKKAPILILDEPTSAVDALTEAKIFDALAHFSKGRTVFLISHRLSTIKHADQIITISHGKVVERGTHQSLLDENKVYAGLYKHHHIS
ncbi:MAG TPA: ABC transporter ATP-binding protein [Flavisolibacter sp.]|nr:ABC transporter ATP-binding protein [Flavisolibacter sp.]